MIRLIDIVRAGALIGLASSCVALSAPAFAGDGDAPQGSIAVRGADFTSPRSVAHLKHQLRRVAMDICLPNPGDRLLMNPDERRCYETAIKDGSGQIDRRQQQAMRERPVQLATRRPSAGPAD